MLEILYCFDENYNTQGFSSIYSLLNQTSSKLNINIVHKTFEDEKFIPNEILNHSNLNSIKVFKFKNNTYTFPNIAGSHVSEATYYRLFLEDYLPVDIQQVVYLDADIICVNDPSEELIYEINKLKNSTSAISCKSELKFDRDEVLTRLEMNSQNYFNAGFMIIDLEKWRTQKIKEGLMQTLERKQESLKYWDQDLLNSYFDGNYIDIDEKFNCVVDLAAYEYLNFSISIEELKSKALFVHYAGSHKPWNINGILCNLSEIYQQSYRDLYKDAYHITHKMKRLSVYYLLKSIIDLSFLRTKFPRSLFFKFTKSLFLK
jgi:lipopolysaccharide biosynthesis glycosyltransferase